VVSYICLKLYFVNNTFWYNFKRKSHDFRTRFRHVKLSAILFIVLLASVLVRHCSVVCRLLAAYSRCDHLIRTYWKYLRSLYDTDAVPNFIIAKQIPHEFHAFPFFHFPSISRPRKSGKLYFRALQKLQQGLPKYLNEQILLDVTYI